MHGLPAASRLAARMVGEEHGGCWAPSDFLALDARDTLESMRTLIASALTREKAKFRQWEHYPGHDAQKRAAARRRFEHLFALAQSFPTGSED